MARYWVYDSFIFEILLIPEIQEKLVKASKKLLNIKKSTEMFIGPDKKSTNNFMFEKK
jgi:hypothetical protein